MEQKKIKKRSEAFTEQFTSVLCEHWADILLIIHRHSPRVASALRVATPTSLKRSNGVWRIRVVAKRANQREKLHQPRDNEIVAQSIRLWAHSAARLRLPRVTVDFEV